MLVIKEKYINYWMSATINKILINFNSVLTYVAFNIK